MRVKCSVFIAASLDGFIARPNGDLDWLEGGGASAQDNYGYDAFFASVDTIVMGRNTYEQVLRFPQWPYPDKTLIVLSHGQPIVPADRAGQVTVYAMSPKSLVEQLAAKGSRHLYIDGGKTIQGFLNEGLIDDLTITRIPVLLGQGIALFGAFESDIKLTHVGTLAYPSGYVQSHYRVVRPD